MNNVVEKSYSRAWRFVCKRSKRNNRAKRKRIANRRARRAAKVALETGRTVEARHLPIGRWDVI